MRGFIKFLLPMLGILVCAGMASAYTITVTESSTGSLPGGGYDVGDLLEVDVVVNTEGEAPWYGVQMYISFDGAVLAAVEASSYLNYAPGMVPGYPYSSLYLYSTGPGKWFAMQSTLSPDAPAFNGSIATLVFHVLNVPASTLTVVDPNFTAGPYGIMVGAGALDVTGDVVLTDLEIHVPEPVATVVALSAIGTLGLLWRARRGRVR